MTCKQSTQYDRVNSQGKKNHVVSKYTNNVRSYCGVADPCAFEKCRCFHKICSVSSKKMTQKRRKSSKDQEKKEIKEMMRR